MTLCYLVYITIVSSNCRLWNNRVAGLFLNDLTKLSLVDMLCCVDENCNMMGAESISICKEVNMAFFKLQPDIFLERLGMTSVRIGGNSFQI